MCEVILRQVNYLIDEAFSVGKGANLIISMIYYYFSYYGFGEICIYFYADNCLGQNKNNFFLWYLANYE